jgi:ankyrin repeat protein
MNVVINTGADVNITNDEDKTPLMIASRLGYIDIVKLLLLYKACINHYSNYEGYDALLESICSTITTSSSVDSSSKDGFNTCTSSSSNRNHQKSNDIENKDSSYESCQNKIKLITLLINSGKHLHREYIIYILYTYYNYIYLHYTYILYTNISIYTFFT